MLSVLTVFGKGPGGAPSAVTLSTYAGQMLIGLVIAGFGARLLVGRAGLLRTGPVAATSTANTAYTAADGRPA
jgi:hypothetical protein